MVTIATFNEPAKAKHLKQRLAEKGVKADIHNEARMQKVMLSGAPQANAKVMVDEKEFPRAHELMLEWETNDPDVGCAIRCPQCNSPRIQYPQLARRFPFTPGLAAIGMALGLFPKEFYCEDCHYTWTNKEDEPRYSLWHRFFDPRKSA